MRIVRNASESVNLVCGATGHLTWALSDRESEEPGNFLPVGDILRVGAGLTARPDEIAMKQRLRQPKR
jgi:hypothetical protein